jgi:GNAT superfamily N-acetyltransferase
MRETRFVARAAAPADALDVAGVHVRAWQAGYRGLLPDAYLDGLRPEDRATRYTFGDADSRAPSTIVALEDDVIVGFATVGACDEPEGANVGALLALYVDPVVWRRGVGTFLMASARKELAARGFSEAILWLLEGNERARRFYIGDGWAPEGRERAADIWGIRVDERSYRRRVP